VIVIKVDPILRLVNPYRTAGCVFQRPFETSSRDNDAARERGLVENAGNLWKKYGFRCEITQLKIVRPALIALK